MGGQPVGQGCPPFALVDGGNLSRGEWEAGRPRGDWLEAAPTPEGSVRRKWLASVSLVMKSRMAGLVTRLRFRRAHTQYPVELFG